MAWLSSRRSAQGPRRSWGFGCGLILLACLPLAQVQAFTDALSAGEEQADQQARQIEQGQPLERELAGGQSHSYRLTLAAGQYVRLVVDQRGIDVAVGMSGPDGKRKAEFDSEIRAYGPETISWVAEEPGSYRVDVRAKKKDAAGATGGSYEIRMVELRTATEDDRALDEARSRFEEALKLTRAGKYDEARPMVEQSLEIRQRILGEEHPDVAASLNNLAILYRNKGDGARAESLYGRALAIREKALGAEHPAVAASLNNLASLYSERGDYTKAEPLYQRALAIWEKAVGPEDPTVSTFLNNIANICKERGDYARAEPLYRRALVVGEKAMGPESPFLGMTLNNLASLYYDRGDYERAEPLYQRVLAVKEKELGPEHPRLVDSLNNLALLYADRGDYARAEPLYQRALAIGEKAFGPEHFNVALSLDNLATLYRRRGDYAKAEPLYGRALGIRERALRPEHPFVVGTLNNMAMLYMAKGYTAQAIVFLSRANAISERSLMLNLRAGSERQRLAYLGLFSKQTNLTLSLHSRVAPNNRLALDLAFTTLLRRKGRGLGATIDTIATLRRHATPDDRQLFDQLAEARSRLAELTFSEPGEARPEIYRAQLKAQEEEVEKLEVALGSRSAEYRAQSQPVTLSAVQATLPAGSALVEFAVYTPLDSKTEKSRPPRYLAYLLAAKGRPGWIDLGEAAIIDRAVSVWRNALRNPKRGDARRWGRIVDERAMRPIRSLLGKMPGETRHLLIAPDGPLNLIPFAALVDERNRYLVERYAISYLTSGRDLLRLQISEPSKNGPLVIADPDFGGPPQSSAARSLKLKKRPSDPQLAEESDASLFSQLYFPVLPSAAEEGEAVRSLLSGATLLTKRQANKAALSQAHSPLLLHIATHGFFLEDPNSTSTGGRGRRATGPGHQNRRLERNGVRVESSLLRSGLALAGANEQKKDDNGILTALEVAGLDLWGTKLVVLSACDTGVGAVKNGEGVQGLRRALVLAGSESQIISLWPVLDRATKELMIAYYKALEQGAGRGEGLRQVQLRMLQSRNRRHPFYWAAFIQSGEWADLEGRRSAHDNDN